MAAPGELGAVDLIWRRRARHDDYLLYLLTYPRRLAILRLPSPKRSPMNAIPAIPVPRAGLVGGLLYRIVAFVALCVGASGLGTTHAKTVQTNDRIVLFAAGLLAMVRNFARLAARPLRTSCGHRAPSAASRATPPARQKSGWMVACVPDAFVVMMASGKPARLVQASSQTLRAVPRLARGFGMVPPALSNARNREHDPRLANPVELAQAGADRVLSTGGDGGSSRASCEDSTGFRTGMRTPRSRSRPEVAVRRLHRAATSHDK